MEEGREDGAIRGLERKTLFPPLTMGLRQPRSLRCQRAPLRGAQTGLCPMAVPGPAGRRTAPHGVPEVARRPTAVLPPRRREEARRQVRKPAQRLA
eukprot:3995973-Pyramimonas_sp.AAC.1